MSPPGPKWHASLGFGTLVWVVSRVAPARRMQHTVSAPAPLYGALAAAAHAHRRSPRRRSPRRRHAARTPGPGSNPPEWCGAVSARSQMLSERAAVLELTVAYVRAASARITERRGQISTQLRFLKAAIGASKAIENPQHILLQRPESM